MGGSTVRSRDRDDRDRGAAGFLGLTRVGGGSTRRAELTRPDRGKPRANPETGQSARAPAFKDLRWAWPCSPRPPFDHAPRGVRWSPPGAPSWAPAAGFELWSRDKRPESRLFLRLPARRSLPPSPAAPIRRSQGFSSTQDRPGASEIRCRPVGFPPPSTAPAPYVSLPGAELPGAG